MKITDGGACPLGCWGGVDCSGRRNLARQGRKDVLTVGAGVRGSGEDGGEDFNCFLFFLFF